MENKQVTIIIVTWNGMKYLPDCLRSIINQTFTDYRIIVIDNASSDNTVDFVRESYPGAAVLENFKNLGFSKAYNQGIKFNESPYVLVMNQDIVLKENFLSDLVNYLDEHGDAGSVGGKLLRVVSEDGSIVSNSAAEIIDSAGLKFLPSRRCIDRGAGEVDSGQFDQVEAIFGLSGAAALYRRKALEQVKIVIQDKNISEYFDETFFMYKEDVDLAWRLRLAGWNSYYVPTAAAYHYRGAYGNPKASRLEVARSRRKKPTVANYHSYKNHLAMVFKNDYGVNFFRQIISIWFYELQKIIYITFLEPSSLKSLIQFFYDFRLHWRKRSLIIKMRQVSAANMRKWFNK